MMNTLVEDETNLLILASEILFQLRIEVPKTNQTKTIIISLMQQILETQAKGKKMNSNEIIQDIKDLLKAKLVLHTNLSAVIFKVCFGDRNDQLYYGFQENIKT